MCGIFGRFTYRGPVGDCEDLVSASDLLAHRGPDDGTWWAEGPFFLGHRRLSIIDVELGSQPMATADGRHVLVFNGEIYNYVELREELIAAGAVFATRSDTEVLLHGYRRWGAELPAHLIGMFAFAIADRVARTLFLARDRFGEKPLFMAENNGGVTFASEVKALAAVPDFTRTLDEASLREYLCLNYVPGEGTLLRGVRRLAPGTWRRFHVDRVESGQYWQPPVAVEDAGARSAGETVAELRRRIDRSVRIALRSDVPVTLFLSGGIDSSIIAESAVRQGHLAHAYCLDFPEASFSEMPKAATVARRLGIELRRVPLTTAVLSEFFDVVDHADDPLGDSSALAVWALSKAVARDYKVVVTGDGGDEVFGGYLTYKATRLHQMLSRFAGRPLRERLAALARFVPVGDGKVPASYKLMRFLRALHLPAGEAHFTWNGTWLPDDAARLMIGGGGTAPIEGTLHAMAARHQMDGELNLAVLQRADARDYLPNDILVKVDRMTMAHGLEARAPFLIPDVAEFGLALPDALKLTTFGQPKRILRRLAADIYGAEIGFATKQGFSIPVHRWIRGPMRDIVEDLLSAVSLARLGVIRVQAVLDAKERHMQGRAQLGFELWGLMVLVAWHRTRIERAPLMRRPTTSMRRIFAPSAQLMHNGSF
jgi:asparagine synthase (glutamine-hydrolysing)